MSSVPLSSPSRSTAPPADRPRITVATVCLNAADALALTIESVLAQTVRCEMLVVDGSSWDGTAAILERYASRIDRIAVIEDDGIFAAMNQAADLASGEYILFLNAGDRLHCADTIEALLARLDGDPDIFYGDHLYLSGPSSQLFRSAGFGWLRETLRDGPIDTRWQHAIPGHQATFTRVELLRRLRYDESFAICADHEFLFRACDEGAAFQYIDEVVSEYVAGGLSGTAGDRVLREWALAYRPYTLSPPTVDAFLARHEGAAPVFPAESRFAGRLLSGGYAPEAADGDAAPYRWVAVPLFEAPATSSAVGVSLTGHCPHVGQRLVASVDGEAIGQVALAASGPFAVTLPFRRALAPGAQLLIAPEKLGLAALDDPRMVAWRLDRFTFRVAAAVRNRRRGTSVAALDEVQARRLFLSGWSGIDRGSGLVWSTNLEAALAMDLAPGIRAVTLHVVGAADEQRLAVLVDGQQVAATPLGEGEGQAVRVPIERHATAHPSVITLCASTLRPADADWHHPRGLALRAIDWEWA